MSVTKITNRIHKGRTGLQKTPRGPWHKQPVQPAVLAALVDGITNLRDLAMVLMLTESGLRGSELVKLDRGMMSLDSQAMGGRGELPFSKSGASRQFWLGRKSVETLVDYLNTEREQDTNDALFVDNSGNRVTIHLLRRIIYRWCYRLGIEEVNLHQFRVSSACQ